MLNKSCNTLTEIFDRFCVPNKTENANLDVFSLITTTTNE